jgi:hemerythrin
MAYQWTPELTTGIDEIDADHRELLGRIADLHGCMRAGQTGSVASVLAGVRSYAKSHFATEEQHMRSLAFPGLERHRAEHARFSSELEAFEREWNARGATPSLAIGLAVWLSGWFRDHIRVFDLEFAAHARAVAKAQR